MTLTGKTLLTQTAIFALAMSGLPMTTPVMAQSVVLEQRSDITPVQPSRQGATDLSGGTTGRAEAKDIWGKPDAFLAKCNAAGGGASTDQDGFPHCEDANGGNIPIPMQE